MSQPNEPRFEDDFDVDEEPHERYNLDVMINDLKELKNEAKDN